MRHHYHSEPLNTVFAVVERAIELNQCELIQPQTSWHGSSLSTSYGDWDRLTDHAELNPSKVFILPNYCSGSDYSGSLVEVSNHKAILESLPGEYEDGIEYLDYSGGHGTFALAIRLDALTPDLLEMLESLEDYPVADESLWSELETESQNEAWNAWAKDEFRTALSKALVSEFEASTASNQRDGETDEACATRVDAAIAWLEDGAEIADSSLSELFWKMAELANVYWANEQGSDSYIDIEDVVKKSLNRKLDSDWTRKAYAEIKSLIQASMGTAKYDHGIVRFIDPNQTQFVFSTEVN